MGKCFKLITFLLLGFIFIKPFGVLHSADIPTEGAFLTSLDWQKISLEKNISDKVSTALSRIITSKQYIVWVTINVNPPRKPRFTPTDGSGGQQGDGDKKKKAKIKISDIKEENLPKDYVVFSKLGLEAPLIEDFDDFKPDKKGVQEKKGKSELPAFEQLWKFNKSLDLFNNLESVKIHVRFSEKLHKDTRQTVEKIVKKINLNLNDISPDYDIKPMDMSEKLNTKDLFNNEFMQFLQKFESTIGIIVAAMFLGIIAWILFNKWEKMQKEKTEKETGGAPLPPPGEDEKDDEGLLAGGPFDEESSDSGKGIERFIAFLDHSPIEAIMLIKKWITTDDKMENNALRALVQQLNNEVLLQVFNSLSSEERDTWKALLEKQVTGKDLIATNAFISNQIVEDILVPSAIVDAEIADLLLRLTPENAAQFVKDDPELGKILMNVMNSKFVVKIIENLDEQNVELILEKSMEFKKEAVEDVLEDFKGKLAQYQDSVSKIPFMGRVVDLIGLSNPARENALFKALAQNVEEMEKLRSVAMDNFPAVLIGNLPDPILKIMLQAYPMNQKVELVSSIDENLRDKFENIFAPVGSKAADVLAIELEKIENDINVQRKIRENGQEIWKEFVEFVRKSIKSDKENAGTYDSMVSQWSQKVMSGTAPENAAVGVDPNKTSVEANLKVAA